MSVADAQPDGLCRLTSRGDKLDEEFKDDLFVLGLRFRGVTDDGAFQLELDSDHFDRLSVEGVARSLRYQHGDARDISVLNTNDPDWTFVIDNGIPDERPYVTGTVVRGTDLDDAVLDPLIQLQEKPHATMDRKRTKGAIDICDLAILKDDVLSENASSNSIAYTGTDPDGDTFVAFDSNDEPTPAEVLEQHAANWKYISPMSEYNRYPTVYDEIDLLSFPPAISSRQTKVSTGFRNLLVELTDINQWIIDRMCNITYCALAARETAIEEVGVQYGTGTVTKPSSETEMRYVSYDRIKMIPGVRLELDGVIDLFEHSGLDANAELGEETIYEVSIPPYRVSVLHPLDLVNDMGRAYGFGEFESHHPDTGMAGRHHERSRLGDAVHTPLVDLNLKDLLNSHMIPEERDYERMDVEVGSDYLDGGEPAFVTEPYNKDYIMLRTWVLPLLTVVLENNIHRAYPQDLAEVGHVAHRDDGENAHVTETCYVAAVLIRYDTAYKDAKARLVVLCYDFDMSLGMPTTDHPLFIDGCTAMVVIGNEEIDVVGELHPKVIIEHDLELLATAFESNLSTLA